jgi:hypothetical protein
VFVLASAAGVAILVTGGVVFRVGDVRVSARRALHPAALALAGAAAAWALSSPAERGRMTAAVRERTRGGANARGATPRPAHGAALVVAVGVAVAAAGFGVKRGLFVAAASDAYGYVSQADLWAGGSPILRQPFARQMTWPNAAETLAPLGYRPHRPAPHGTDIVPIYAPGLPLLMAAFRLVGGAEAVYFVVPLLGGLAVLATYAIGFRLAGPFVGVSGAVLLALSPSFLFEVISPTSDVPATAWWALCLALLLVEGAGAAFAAGVAAGLGILTRPNLVPVALVPAAWLVWRAVRAWRAPGPDAATRESAVGAGQAGRRVLAFAAGSLPACAAVGAINAVLYGSPLDSGYGSLEALYDWSHLGPNLERYPRWLVENHTPLVLLALLAPLVLPRRGEGPVGRPRPVAVVWLTFIGFVAVPYLFYLPFEEWWYLRFLMPAYPPLFVLIAAVVWTLMRPLDRMARGARALGGAVVVAGLAWHGATFAFDRGAHLAWMAEQRYEEAGRYVADHLPARAAILSMQHSGGLRFYSGRITVRYDLVAPTDLDLVISELRRLGYQPYLVLDQAEEAPFRERFGDHSAVGRLDWLPLAVLHRNEVRIYELPERPPARP